MNPGKPTPGWDQIMTLPRRLTLRGQDELRMEPVAAVEALRGEHVRIESMTLPANEEVVLDGVSGNAMELLAEIDPQGSSVIEMNVLRSSGQEEFTRIAFYKNRGFHVQRDGSRRRESLISIDSSRASLAPDATCRAPETAPIYLENDEPLQLRVFLDRSVVEVFVNGKQCVAVRVYPEREDSLGVSLRAQGREAALNSLDAWPMASVYE